MAMRGLMALLFFSGWGCAPIIPRLTVPARVPISPVAEIEVCQFVSEHQVRPLFMGVSGFSFAPWNQVIGSVVVKHPNGLTVIDPAFGYEVGRDVKDAPFFIRASVMGTQHGKSP